MDSSFGPNDNTHYFPSRPRADAAAAAARAHEKGIDDSSERSLKGIAISKLISIGSKENKGPTNLIAAHTTRSCISIKIPNTSLRIPPHHHW